MTALKLTQIGNSVGVILAKEVPARLKLEKGQQRVRHRRCERGDADAIQPRARPATRFRAGFHARVPGRLSSTRQMNWTWVDRRAPELLHDESLAKHGGASGLRDEGLLDSTLARPLNLAAYGRSEATDLAAAYGVGLAKNPLRGWQHTRGAPGGRPLPRAQRPAPRGEPGRCHVDSARRGRRPDGRSRVRTLAAWPHRRPLNSCSRTTRSHRTWT